MDLGLAGKGALVVGATGAIGGAVADALVREGARVAAAGRSSERLDAIAEHLGAGCVTTLPVELKDPASVSTLVLRAAEALDGIDILVCAAAGDAFVPVWDVSRDTWNDELQTKYLGTADLCRQVTAHMVQRHTGVVVAMTGIAAHQVFTTNPMNGAANVALENTLRVLAVAAAPAGVRVLGVSPGMTRSRRFSSFAADRLAEIAASIPLGRIAEPKDLADLTVFLTSECAAYLTATVVVADGGLSAWDARLPLPGNDFVEGPSDVE